MLDQLLPVEMPNSLHPKDLIHSALGNTAVGGLVDIAVNEDFKGTPIENKYDEYLPSNERYSENTSNVAYAFGQTKFARNREISPKQIDHLLSSYLGIIGDLNTSLLPMNKSRKDISAGFRNRFISDSNYSTDVLNKLYDNRDIAKKAFDYSGSADDAVEYEKNAIVTSYISGMNKAVKALPDEKQRAGRAFLLKSLNAWDYDTTDSQNAILENLNGETVDNGCVIKEIPSSFLEWSKNGYKYSYQMTPQEYNVYVKEYLNLIETHRGNANSYRANTQRYMSELEKANSNAKEKLKEKYRMKFHSKADRVEQ